jgi:hypothetical protein
VGTSPPRHLLQPKAIGAGTEVTKGSPARRYLPGNRQHVEPHQPVHAGMPIANSTKPSRMILNEHLPRGSCRH